MDELRLIATTGFGLEAICRRELEDLGLDIIKTENGRVFFSGTFKELALANVWLRTADRVLIELDSFEALSFEDLFDKVYDLPWPEMLPENANFIVNAKSIKSKLFSLRDIQSIGEKALVEKLKTKYKRDWFDKSGALYKLEISILKDQVSLSLDSSGSSLHRRGYRKKQGLAPLKETLAAGLVLLSFWNKDRTLYDPFCGSGTILFEAGLIGKNIAPGLRRSFAFNNWAGVDHSILKEVKDQAHGLIRNEKLDLIGSDIDPEVLELAKEISIDLGFENDLKLYNMDYKDLNLNKDYGIVITNPPYGKRISQGDHTSISQGLKRKFKGQDTWSLYILTSDETFERNYGRKANRRRKLYNGRIKVDYYQYYGKKPKR